MSHGADGPEEQLEQRLTAAELAAARALAGRLPALIEELAACGLPGTLLHGDFPGNRRSDGSRAVVVDDPMI